MGKNPLPILFTYYSLKIKFVPFLKSWLATIPCKGKTIKWATKLLIKKKGEGKRERERKIEIDSEKKFNFWLVGMREKKKLSIYVRVVGKYAFFVAFLC